MIVFTPKGRRLIEVIRQAIAFLPYLCVESPRWLVSRGRVAEADQILARVEAEISDGGQRTLAEPTGEQADARPATARISDLFRGIYLKRTLVVWTIWFCTYIVIYGLVTWMPSVFRTVYKATLQESLQIGFEMAVMGAIATLVAVMLIDLIGRKALFCLGLVGAAIPLFVLGYRPDIDLSIVRVLVFVAFFLISFLAISLSTYTAELYPTEVRATAVGAGNVWLRLAAVIGLSLIGVSRSGGFTRSIICLRP
jgi:putative MFS transporter